MLITIYEHLERIIRVSTVFIWRRARSSSSSGSSCTACHAAVLDARHRSRIVHDSTPDIIDAPPQPALIIAVTPTHRYTVNPHTSSTQRLKPPAASRDAIRLSGVVTETQTFVDG